MGAYYKGGLTAIDGVVVDGYDRAAPAGVGNIKAAGNYAPDVLPSSQQKKLGFPICLYLDAKENAYVEEFSTSNFLGVTKDGALAIRSNPGPPAPSLSLILTLSLSLSLNTTSHTHATAHTHRHARDAVLALDPALVHQACHPAARARHGHQGR